MKLTKISLLLPLLGFTLLFSNCKKNNDDQEDKGLEIVADSDDQSRVSGEIDAVGMDANILLEFEPGFSGDNSILDEMICDASVVIDTDSDPMTITVTYNGSNCGFNRTRTGTVILSMAKGTKWKDAGSSVTVTYQDLVITRKSDNKSITINGSHTCVNESGGLLVQLALLENIIHVVNGSDLSVKFDNGTARTWNVARKRSFTYNNGIVMTVTGNHTEGNNDQIAEWGLNRLGASFVTTIIDPVVVKQSCDFRVTSGTVEHATSGYTAMVQFGLDNTGTPTACPGSEKYYYKLTWQRAQNGSSFNMLIPY